MLNKFAYVAIGAIFSASMLFMSCSPPKDMSIDTPTPDIHNIKEDVKSSSDTLTGTTSSIKENTNQTITKTPPAVKPVLEPHLREILVQVGIQEKVLKDMDRIQAQLGDAEKKSVSFEDAFKKEQELRKKAESNATKELREKYTWISVACFAGLVVAITVGLSGIGGGPLGKLAQGAAVAFGIGLVVSIALIQTVALIPWIVGGMVLVGGGIVIYRFVQKERAIKSKSAEVSNLTATANTLSLTADELAKAKANLEEHNSMLNKAALELTHTAELAKPFMLVDGRKQVYGDGPIPGHADSIQSPETKELVKELRAQLTNIAPSIPETVAQDYNGDGVIDDLDEEYRNNLLAQQSTSSRVLKRSGGRRVASRNKAVIIIR
jgi:hypothetical protein